MMPLLKQSKIVKDNKSVAKTHCFAPKSLFLLRGMAQVRKNAGDLCQGELLTN